MEVGALRRRSQENNILSVTRPDKLIGNLKQGPVDPRFSAESTKLRIDGHCVEATENSVTTRVQKGMENPYSGLKRHDSTRAVLGDPGAKRKRLPGELELVESVCTKLKNFPREREEKLTATNGGLILESDMQKDMSSDINGKLGAVGNGRCPPAFLLDDGHVRNYKPSKKVKVSLNQERILEPGRKENLENMTHGVETEVTKDAGVSVRTVSHANPSIGTIQSCRDEPVSIPKVNQETEVSLKNMTCEDIMKLLELDDPDDEERFRMALERPLSPTLPEIDTGHIEALEVDNSITLKEGIHSGMVNEIDNTVPCCHIDVEKDSSKMNYKSSDVSDSSALHSDWTMRDAQAVGGVDCFTDSRNTFSFQVEGQKQLPNNEAKSTEERRHESVPKYFVSVPDIKDKNSIPRIISACERCIISTFRVPQNAWMVERILVALAKEDDLLPEEKACVLFTLLLHNFLVVTSVNFRNFFSEDMKSCSESLLTHMKAVMSDVTSRSILLELVHLDTLLVLIESFLIDKRVTVYTNVSYQQHLQHDSHSITLLDGTGVLLSSGTATTDNLVAGSFILASLCATTGRIGFICEASYKFLRMHRSDTYLTLTVLHVFASLCGSKYISSKSHSLIMAVIKSLVACLESERPAKFHPCAQCVFSQGVDSVDEVLSLLLEKLQDYAVKMIGYRPDTDVTDILSLVELLAYYMSWDWTCSKVIPQLLEVAKSCVSEKVSAAILLLLGQLGRFGIGESGSLPGVEELRSNLSSLLTQRSANNYTLPRQFAIVHSLTSLLSVNFGELAKNGVAPSDSSEHVDANVIKTWFTHLSEEQKSWLLGFLQNADAAVN